MPKVTPSKNIKRSSNTGKKTCSICGGHFRPQAFTGHFKKCEREKEETEGRLLYEKDMLDRARASLAGNVAIHHSFGIPCLHLNSQAPSSSRAAIGVPTAYDCSTSPEHYSEQSMDAMVDISGMSLRY